MSFNIALSGISSAQKDLDVTANNVANVRTTGFKGSRAEFADVFANNIFSGSDQQTGNGSATGGGGIIYALGLLIGIPANGPELT